MKPSRGQEIGGIGITRTKDLLVEVKCAAENRSRLDSAFCDVVGESATSSPWSKWRYWT